MKINEFRRNFLTLTTTVVIIILGGGIYFYYFFFRQVNAQLIETIPTDAAFLFQINDNETFLKTVKKIHTRICPLFELDAYPGCQFFVDQLPGKYNQVVFSGHHNGEKLSILFACKINERAFSQLLPKLQIDVKNCLKYEQCKIYSYGTHLKRFVFTYHKGVFLASENITLLKRAITQLKNPKNLINLKSFETLFAITEKNKKQNWLILNHKNYFSNFESFFNETLNNSLTRFSSTTLWAAYQVRFSELQMFLSGYLSINNNFEEYINSFGSKYFYFSSLEKNDEPISFEKDEQFLNTKSLFPSDNDFEIAIHAENSEYWGHFLSETGIKKFTLAKMKLFAFSLRVESLHLTSQPLAISNGLITF